jgi:hypothetical protein
LSQTWRWRRIPVPLEFSAPFRTLRVFTILPSKQVTMSLEIKLHTKANLSNGKGDNSINTENPVNSVRIVQSIQFLSFRALTDRIRSEHKQDTRREVPQLSNGYLYSLIRQTVKELWIFKHQPSCCKSVLTDWSNLGKTAVLTTEASSFQKTFNRKLVANFSCFPAVT